MTVRDHGPGLDPGTIEPAFDRFWRADSSRVGTRNGAGLAIVAAIAEEHDGPTRATNATDGGACFTIRPPPGPGPAEIPGGPAATGRAAAGIPPRPRGWPQTIGGDSQGRCTRLIRSVLQGSSPPTPCPRVVLYATLACTRSS